MERVAGKGVRIGFRELPRRARLASAAEMSRLFGGCGGDQAACNEDKDCCDGFHCLTASWHVCVSDTQGQPL
jgi:hypothetical protein